MAKRAPASWGREIHYDGARKCRENAPAGIRDAADGPGRIDLDSQMTAKDVQTLLRTFANTHWADLRDYIWTKKSEVVAREHGIPGVIAGHPCNANVHKIPWELTATAVSKVGRYPICSMGSQIVRAAKQDVDIEHETKDVPTVAEFKRIFAIAAKAYGPDWRKHYVVKRLWTKPGARTCLSNAKKADPLVNTLAIYVPADQVAHLPAYVDYYRRG